MLPDYCVTYVPDCSQSPAVIAETLKLVGIAGFWDALEPKKPDKEAMLAKLNSLVKRRNQIAHEGDRMSSRKSGKKLRPVSRAEVQAAVDLARRIVAGAETAFPA